MLFYEKIYLLIFLPFTLLVFFLLNKLKINFKIPLIFLSLIFYSWWNINYLPLIIFTITIGYSFGILIKQYKKIIFLYLGIANILILLIIFKYLDFIIDIFNNFFDINIQNFNLPFPLAISFYSFQIIAFLINIYDKEIKKINFIDYSLFVIFFPQLIAGPIMKYLDLVPQFNKKENLIFNLNNFNIGMIILFIGFIKKIIFANYLSNFVDSSYEDIDSLNQVHAWIVSYAFTFQFYFDFSGYVDMATGSAMMFNIKLSQNFDSPYKAQSLIGFWRRWHMTLTNFLTNFIYIPWLKKLKKPNFFKSMFIILFVFLLAGAWHGAGWNFLVFGLIHGIGLIINHSYRNFNTLNLNKLFSWFLTFNYVNLSFIFFRLTDLNDGINVIKKMFFINSTNLNYNFLLQNLNVEFFIIFLLSFILCLFFKNTYFLISKLKN